MSVNCLYALHQTDSDHPSGWLYSLVTRRTTLSDVSLTSKQNYSPERVTTQNNTVTAQMLANKSYIFFRNIETMRATE